MSPKEDLKEVLSGDLIDHLPKGFEIIGDVAILSVPPELDEHKKHIAGTLISRRKNIRTVLNKVSKLEGDKRVAHYELLAGNSTVTTYKEFGHTYMFDVGSVFFNSRLGHERRRVALKALPGETVLIPFSGVGPFAVPVAARGCRVIAVEKSHDACRWLLKNSEINNVKENIAILNGDAFSISRMLDLKADRAIVPTPYGMDDILEILISLVKKEGTIHFYTFKKRHQIEGLIEKYQNAGLETEFYHRCGNVAPGVSRWVFDLKKV